jgi:ABC-type multidrug transport system permease subunit
LEEADALADRLAIIDDGHIVTEGTSQSLKQQIAGDVVTLGLETNNGHLQQARALMESQPFVRELHSGVLLPMTLAPDLLRTLAQFNPFTHAVDAARVLVNGQLGDASILRGLGIFAGLAALAMFWAVSVFRRSTA